VIPSNKVLVFVLSIAVGGLLLAQEPAPATSTGKVQSPESVVRMANEIHKQIVLLSSYGVFDDIRFSIKDYAVTLRGSASRPVLRSSIENVVKKVEGVESVNNQIEVLPPGGNDDTIRTRVYFAIYFNPSLSRYNPNRGGLENSVSRRAFGLTNDPPIGFHPIHIIVKNGQVTLTGVVDNEGDRTMAGIQANSVPGAFSVTNDLLVTSEAKPKKPKK
jgi:hyperosmotically inducible protein